ncbi:MAG: carboxypeptidase regulatory-like domain-containing protein [Archangium sp.]|nr:carboxypeptidase regulatory-like domain-containing protein [Archangium sp.]
MLRAGALWVGAVLLAGCFDLEVPPKPVRGPGTIRATLVTAVPGRSDTVPAAGATVALLETSLSAVADADGNVRLEGIPTSSGRLMFSVDVDRDGVVDRSRALTLEELGAGFGKDVNIGQLVIGRNATVVGRVKRADRAELNAGHGGITVFLPQLPSLTLSGDDGSFVLDGVPEGHLVVSFFAPGYRPEATTISVGSGEEKRLGLVTLVADPGAQPVGRLAGTVQLTDGTPIAAVTVRAVSDDSFSVSTNAEGAFAFEALPTGVFSLALEKPGHTSLRVDGVLVRAGLNQVGPYVLTAGTSTSIALPERPAADGGAPTPLDGGTDAGPTDAGSTTTTDAGSVDDGGATFDAGTSPDAGVPLDAGTSTDAGSATDAGTPPLAVVGPAQIVLPGATVTLNGTGSQGDQPLGYTWTRLAGPAVTLSVNASAAAHSPTFTAGPSGSVYDFALTVIDRFGVSSTNLAVARVAVGSTPVARFGPDGGLFTGGQTILLQSTSFDDGGLLLTLHEWALVSGAQGALVADGGPSALFTMPPVAFMAPDVLTGVSLRVTNSIGAVSGTTSRVYTVRGGNPNTWSIDAGPAQNVSVGAVPPTVQLTGTVTQSVAGTPSVSWSCAPSMPLLQDNTLTPSFVAPVIVGPQVPVLCTLTATGAPPLSPAQLTASNTVLLRDTLAPTVTSTGIEPARVSPWGWTVTLSEPVSDVSGTSGGCVAMWTSWRGRYLSLLPTNELPTTGTCPSIAVQLDDTATPFNRTSSAQVKGPFEYRVLWEGPFVSTQTFDDPRPVVASLGQVPKASLELAGVTAPLPTGAELLATQGNGLVRFPSFDVGVSDAGCAPSCAMASQSVTIPSFTAGNAPLTARSFFSGAEMFVALQAVDGGAPVMARRDSTGTWDRYSGLPGVPFQGSYGLGAYSVDGGQVYVHRYFAGTGSWQVTDIVGSGYTQVSDVVGTDLQLVLTNGPTRAMSIWNRGTFTWSQASASTFPANTRNLVMMEFGGTRGVLYQPSTGALEQYRTGASVGQDLVQSTTAVTGFDVVTRGGVQITAISDNGDIRLTTFRYNHWGTGINQFSFAGPPRTGYMAPYPLVLDNDPVCEAVHPRLAMVDDALVVVWQERCTPSGPWNVVARVVH